MQADFLTFAGRAGPAASCRWLPTRVAGNADALHLNGRPRQILDRRKSHEKLDRLLSDTNDSLTG